MYFHSFTFDVVAFLESEDVKNMTTQQVGAYWLLLSHSWQQERPCYLPADHARLQHIARMSESEWVASRKLLLSKFVLEDKYIYNPRLLAEYNKLKSELEALITSMGARTIKKLHKGDVSIVVQSQLKVVDCNQLQDLLPPAAKTGRKPQYLLELLDKQREKIQTPGKNDLLYSIYNTTTNNKSILVNSNNNTILTKEEKIEKEILAEPFPGDLLPVELNTPEVERAWKEFSWMRRNYKKLTGKKNVPITDSIAKRLCKELIKLCTHHTTILDSQVAINILNRSHDKYWIDLYPITTQTQTHTNDVKRTHYDKQRSNKL